MSSNKGGVFKEGERGNIVKITVRCVLTNMVLRTTKDLSIPGREAEATPANSAMKVETVATTSGTSVARSKAEIIRQVEEATAVGPTTSEGSLLRGKGAEGSSTVHAKSNTEEETKDEESTGDSKDTARESREGGIP